MSDNLQFQAPVPTSKIGKQTPITLLPWNGFNKNSQTPNYFFLGGPLFSNLNFLWVLFSRTVSELKTRKWRRHSSPSWARARSCH